MEWANERHVFVVLVVVRLGRERQQRTSTRSPHEVNATNADPA
jgi:hypothetical protein